MIVGFPAVAMEQAPLATALLLVDLQEGTVGSAQPTSRPGFDQRFQTRTLPKLQKLLALCRRQQLEVIHTVIENLTADGRDRSVDYKRCGMGFAPGSDAARVIAPLAPQGDELVLSKSSSSPFSSTSLDYLLRNLGIQQLIVAGVLTDQCIDHTIKDAADRGYRVICPTDACQADSDDRHRQALACFQGYARFLTVETLELELVTTGLSTGH